MKIRIKFTIALILGLLIIGGIGIQSYLEIQRLSEANREVVHSHKVMEGLERVLSLLKDAETGQRGYLITYKDIYLDPYRLALLAIPNALNDVASLIKNNPQQVKSLQQLHKFSFERLAGIKVTIKLRRAKSLAAVLKVNNLDRGKQLMDQIRAIIDQMIRREEMLLEKSNSSVNKLAQLGSWWVGIGMLFGMGVLGVIVVIVTKTMSFMDQEEGFQAVARKRFDMGITVRYAFAIGVVGIACQLHWWFGHSLGVIPPFIIFFPSVLLVATIAGGGPGILTCLLSALAADYWFIEPFDQFGNLKVIDALTLGIFVGTSIFLCVLVERMRRAQVLEAISSTVREGITQSEERFQRMADSISQLAWIARGEGDAYWYNKRWYEYTGATPEQMENGDWQSFHAPDELSKVQEQWKAAIASGQTFDMEFPLRGADGLFRTFLTRAIPFKDSQGQVIQWFGTNTDISKRKKAEDILKHDKAVIEKIVNEKTKQLLEVQVELDSNKRLSEIGVLAATVAHELRNPLASIELSAFHIKRTIKDPRIEGDISSIKKCLSESDQIINNILLYSKLKTSHLRGVKINSILKECIDEAIKRFPNQNITVNVKTDLTKDLFIEADPLQMKEVFSNILNNAFDAFNKNAGIIDIESQVDDFNVSIFIRDNGEGIEKNNLDKVFDPFFTTKTQGTGLGLAVCNLAIKLHHGSIVIKSEKSKGTTVIVTLPIGKQKNAKENIGS